MAEDDGDIFAHLNRVLFNPRNIEVINRVVSGPMHDIAKLTVSEVADVVTAFVASGADVAELARILGIQMIEHSRDPVVLASKIIELRKKSGR